MFFAFYESWSLDSLLWVFWFQNIIIGFFHFVRMLKVENFYIDDPNAELGTPRASKIAIAIFFLLHFGIFQVVYLAFLLSGSLHNHGPVAWRGVLIAVACFFVNHALSFFQNTALFTRRQDLMKLMMVPYGRIIPMHFFAIMGGFFFAFGSARLPLLFFLFLKTIADVMSHVAQTAAGDIKPKQKTA